MKKIAILTNFASLSWCVKEKGRITMSGINALSSSKVAFCGKKAKSEKTEEAQTEKKPSFIKTVGAKIAQPVKDEFHKAYGEDAEPTAALVADFVADNALKIGVAVAGTALFLAKSRKLTCGLTNAIKDNVANIGKEINGKKQGISSTLKKTLETVKANDKVYRESMEAAKAGLENQELKLTDTVAEAIFRPVEFKEGTKLAGFVDKVAGKNSAKVKQLLGKVGVADTPSLIDTAIAGTATATLGTSAVNIAGDVAEKDNKELAREAQIKKFENLVSVVDKFERAANML